MGQELGGHKLVRVYAKHDPYWDTGHLGEVIAEMKTLGPPTIQVVEWRDHYFAIEGSHRLAAAFYLGLTPKLDIKSPDRFSPEDENFWDNLREDLPHYAWLQDV